MARRQDMSPERGTNSESTSLIASALQDIIRTIRDAEKQGGVSHEDAVNQTGAAVRDARKRIEADEKARAAESHNARNTVRALEGEAGAKARALAGRDLRGGRYAAEELSSAQVKLEAVRKALPANELPSWLGVEDIQHSDAAAEFASRIAMMPKDLQDDPYVLYREAARLYHSTSWNSDALSSQSYAETIRVLNAVHERANVLLQEQGQKIASMQSVDAFINRIDGRPNIYRTKRLPDPDTSKDAGDPPYKDPGKKTIDAKSEEFIRWKSKRVPEVQQEQLDKTLRYYQTQIDNHGDDYEETKRLLRELEGELRKESTGTRSVSIEDERYGVKYSVPSRYDAAQSQPYLDNVVQEASRVEALQEQEKRYEQNVRAGRDPLVVGQPSIESAITSGWIYQKTPDGTAIVPEDYIDQETGEAVSLQSLRNTLSEINESGMSARFDQLNEGYKKLQALTDPNHDNPLPPEVVKPYLDTLEYVSNTMASEQRFLTPERIRRIEDPATRDEEFWRVLRPLLDDTNQRSSELLDLYKQQEIKSFLHVLSEMRFSEDVLDDMRRRGINPEDIRSGLVRHYTNIKETLVSMHDLDYYTRSASGDIKSFKTAVHYFSNPYFTEAVEDPVIETLIQCNEQALKQILLDNNGYIPPALVTYDSLTRENEWDRRTWQLFEAKVRANAVYDYKRTSFGYGELDETGLRYVKNDTPMTLEEFKSQRLRMQASLQIAKGAGLLTQRSLEIFAKSKTPGYLNREKGTNKIVFSSKGYEGIARWFNPMADFFGKFKMGSIEHKAFFGALIGIEESDLKAFWNMKPEQWIEVENASKEGRLREWFEQKYPEKGKVYVHNMLRAFENDKFFAPEKHTHIERMLDMTDPFSFSGVFGPLSGWRESDMTIGFTDLDREKEGGSMRLFKAKAWAASRVIKEWEEERLTASIPGYRDMNASQKAQVRAEREGILEAEWGRIMQDEKARHPFDQKIEAYKRKYRAFVWVQMADRSPTIIAPHILVNEKTYLVKGQRFNKTLRAHVLEEVLRDDPKTREYLESKHKEPGRNLDMIADVATESTPDEHHRKLYARIGVLESDVMAVQQRALHGGENGAPRDITEDDFNHITGDATIVVNNRNYGVIDQETRRRQAKQYVKMVQERVKGSWSSQQWRERIGLDYDNDAKTGKLVVDQESRNIWSVLEDGAEAGSALRDVVDKEVSSHMGVEDLHWGELMWKNLGERHFARRANDLEARTNTILAMIKYLDLVQMHPDQKEMVKGLQAIWAAEKEHDPLEGEKFVWLWTHATGQMYRESFAAKLPFIGRILPKLGHEVSIMQTIYGAEDGASWSANNVYKFVHDVSNAIHMSPHAHMPDGSHHPYNAHELEKRLGATKRMAAVEMFLIGTGLTVAAVAASAVATGAKSELGDDSGGKKSGH